MLGRFDQRLAKQRFEFVQAGFVIVTGLEVRCLGKLLDDRIQRAVSVIGRALIADTVIIFGRQTIDQRLDNPRFTDTGFARKQHQLAFAGFGLPPAFMH